MKQFQHDIVAIKQSESRVAYQGWKRQEIVARQQQAEKLREALNQALDETEIRAVLEMKQISDYRPLPITRCDECSSTLVDMNVEEANDTDLIFTHKKKS